jgi:ABC-2 type transport system ATP-binding protein
MLEFEGVSKEYRRFLGGSFRALNDFTLQVNAGEIFGFLGPNGAGKTTAIHLAMGFMRPTSGRGRLLGKPFGDARTRQRVGFLPENVALYPRRAQQLVRFYGAINGMTSAEVNKRAGEVLELLGLLEHGGSYVSRFSRGMLQRVGLAQALVIFPELLILDETS